MKSDTSLVHPSYKASQFAQTYNLVTKSKLLKADHNRRYYYFDGTEREKTPSQWCRILVVSVTHLFASSTGSEGSQVASGVQKF